MEGDFFGPGAGGEGDCFNPRPRMGGDTKRVGGMVVDSGFNPRPRMGGDFALAAD